MIDSLLDLATPWGYVAIALLAAAEGALFLGLVLPGEASMIVGGVLVFNGSADLTPMLVSACAGAVVGDSIGYWLGRTFGPRLRRSALGRRVGEERWERANEALRRRGGWAVFVGRFIGFLRALMPTIAGQAHIPYGRFLVFNAAGGILWSGGFVLLGVAAGRSWHLVERWAGRASLILLVLLVLVAAIVVAAHWASVHRAELLALAARVKETPRVVRFRRRFPRQIAFVKRRLDPAQRFGLYLTVGAAVTAGAAWIFGVILDEVLANEDIVVIDRPTLRFLVSHREPWLNAVMEGITMMGNTVVVAAVLGSAAVASYVLTNQTRWPAFLTAALVGGLALDNLLKPIVGRERPQLRPLVEASGDAFPSGHATAAAALFLALAFVLTRARGWRQSVWIWAAAAGLALLVAVSRVYLGVHWPTDVLAGLALGALWVAVAATITAAWPRAQGGSGSVGWG